MKLKNLLPFILLLFNGLVLKAQISTPNIDFEMGTTAYWNYYRGQNTQPGLTGPAVWSLTSCAAIPTLHMLTSGTTTDPYGGFPVVGDGLYSLRLGKDSADYNADGASYHVHVPATGNYKLTYRYALLFENPGHSPSQQPRFEVSVTDSASGISMPCYSYIEGASAVYRGFLRDGSTDLWYKPWTAYAIDLSSLAGKTVIISFRVGGCTLSGHWGYAYIDMNTGVTSVIPSSCYSTTDTFTGPVGDSLYKWTDSATYTAAYGSTQTLIISSTVTATYAMIVTPYTGYGCIDTLYYKLNGSFTSIKSDDTTICYGTSVPLTDTAVGTYGPFTYSWSPATGLSCTTCATVVATPPAGTLSYLVTVTTSLGCHHTDTIHVTTAPAISAITGPATMCNYTTNTLSDATAGGIWASSNTTVATIGSVTGMVTSISPGTATIMYMSGGCNVITTVTVTPGPLPITGTTGLCAGTATALTDAIGGGVWTSGNTAIAIVSGGVVTGLGAGTATITYGFGSCISMIAVTVAIMPASISPVPDFCSGAAVTMSDVTGGGSWTSGNTAIATIGASSGYITGISPGTSIMTYTIGSCSVFYTATVDPLPGAITGVTTVIAGSTTSLSNIVSGGAWTSANTTIATIDPITGIATGVAAGTDTIYYSIGTCDTYTVITVLPLSALGSATMNNARTGAIHLFPNPAQNLLNITWDNLTNDHADLVITDIVGRELYKTPLAINTTTGQAEIKLNDFSNGIYLITIQSGDFYYCGKLVIQQ